MEKFSMLPDRVAMFLKKNRFWLILYLMLFIFFYLTPMTGDDLTFYAHRSSVNSYTEFVEISRDFYENVNGRIFGNGLAILFAHGMIISSIFRAAVVLLVVFLIVKLFGANKAWQRNLILITLLVLPAPIFAQSLVWRSGFYVYAVSFSAVLLVFFFAKKLAKSENANLMYLILLSLLSFITSLFVETVSIALLSTIALAMLYIFIKKHRKRYLLVGSAALFGALCGSLLMFSSPAYSNITNDADYYRSIGVREVDREKGNANLQNLYKISRLSISNYYIVFVPMTAVTLFYTYSLLKKRQKSRFLEFIAPGLSLYILISDSIIFRQYLDSSYARVSQVLGIFHILASVTFSFIFIYSVNQLIDNNKKNLARVIQVFLLFTVIPLIFVSPFGPRNFYSVYMLIMMLLLLVIFSKFKNLSKSSDSTLNRMTASSLVVVGILYIAMFFSVYRINERNIDLVKQASNEKHESVVLERLPFGNYIHDENNALKMNRAIAGYCGDQVGFDRTDVCYKVNIKFE